MLPGTPAQPMPAPDGVLLVRDEDELLAAIRGRLDELGVTYDVLDRVAGLPDRFSSKLLCRPPARHVSALTLWLVLGAVGYKIALVHDEDALAKVKGLLSKRKIPNRRITEITVARRRMSLWLFTPERGREMAKLRAAKLTPEQRTQSARKASRVRWKWRSEASHAWQGKRA
jgi:hypothetical protein